MYERIRDKFTSAGMGNRLELPVDYCVITDAVPEAVMDALEKIAVFDPTKVVVIIDHDTPNSTAAVGLLQRRLINFAMKQHTGLFNCQGVGYKLMLEHYVQANQVVVGYGHHLSVFAAVHACGISVAAEKLLQVLQRGTVEVTVPAKKCINLQGNWPENVAMYDVALHVLCKELQEQSQGKLLEVYDCLDRPLSLDERYTLCSLLGKSNAACVLWIDGDDAISGEKLDVIDLAQCTAAIATGESKLAIVAAPMLHKTIDEAFIGGCGGGKIEDLRTAAVVLQGQHVAKHVRLIISPISSSVYIQALQEGLLQIFMDAGAVVMNQGCSVCWGKGQGILDADEVLISTGYYNFAGCSGDESAKVYLASPRTVANSAVAGQITVQMEVEN